MQFSQIKIYRKTMDLIDLSQIVLRDLPSGYGHRPSAIGHRLSVFDYRPSVIGNR
ncbi:MAG: hypothetical protein QGI45_16900 [Myxococcota bacterium]|nr:hypothetical protein [Myxococcota bacterium]